MKPDYVVAADKPRHEFVVWFTEDFAWASGLSDFALVHHDDQVGKRERFFLAVCDVEEADAEIALQSLEFSAHPNA